MIVESGKFYFIKDKFFDVFEVFGKVLGKEKAFLIQNIFPTTEEYIESKYKNKEQDVEITDTLKKEIIETSMNVIKLAKKGFNIPFYDIIEMRNILLK